MLGRVPKLNASSIKPVVQDWFSSLTLMLDIIYSYRQYQWENQSTQKKTATESSIHELDLKLTNNT